MNLSTYLIGGKYIDLSKIDPVYNAKLGGNSGISTKC